MRYRCERCGDVRDSAKRPRCRACGSRRTFIVGSWAIWTDTNLPQRGQRVKGKTIETRADVARARANGIEWYSKRDGEYCDSRRGKAAIEAYERSLREQGVREPMPIKLRSEKRHASRRRKVAC